MKHLSVNVWSVILLTLAGAVSLALIAAAWLMATFCLNGLHRFGLPMGLFSVAMLLIAVPSNAQTSANDGYFVIYERIYYPQPNTTSVIPRVVDTLRRHQTVLPVKQTRSIRPVPEWPKEEPVDQPVSEPTNNPFILTMPPDEARLIGNKRIDRCTNPPVAFNPVCSRFGRSSLMDSTAAQTGRAAGPAPHLHY